ncbi:PAS domain S-box protein [uncultured Methanospirillum sp.]|uniref:PAS domain S-box protein n=1 Tax=uncultured Methanospirillum sp. TaxID=262503 RepID=UPI0029C88AC3|nr:PAS domain S-box protein [uncultured Methanospirillum sp.]
MIKVLAVDDEPAFADILGIYLKDIGGFDVEVFSSPEKALEYLTSFEVDAIISDYMMVEMDGIAFFNQVKTKTPDIPFILLTGQDDSSIFLQAIDAGIDFIQLKSDDISILFNEIGQKIRISVGKYRANKELQSGIKQREMFIAVQRNLMSNLSTSSTQSQASDACLTSVRLLAGCTQGSIHILNPVKKKVELLISHNLSNSLLKKFTFGDIHKVIFQGESVYYPVTGRESEDLISGGQIPIHGGDTVIGALSFILEVPHPINPPVRDTIEILVSQLGNAIIRIQSEEQVRNRQEELNELYVAMQELVFVIDMDGTILSVNPAVTRTLGYQEDELVGSPIYVLYSNDIRDAIIYQFLDLTGTGSSIKNEFPFITRDGTLIPVETRGTVGVWGGRNVLFSISRDISERVKAERSEHEYYERIQAILSSSTAQIYMKDKNLQYLTANNPFIFFAGREIADIEGKTDMDLFSDSIATNRQQVDREVIETDRPVYNIEEHVLSKEGVPVWLVTSKVPVHDLKGDVTGIVGTSLDITDLVITRQELIYRDTILSAVSSIAKILVKSEDWEKHIPICLNLLGLSVKNDYLLFSRFNPNDETFSCQIIHDWLSEGTSPSDQVFYRDISTRILLEKVSVLSKSPSIQGNSEDISDELKIRYRDRVPASFLYLPIFVSDSLWGAIGILNFHSDQQFSHAIIDSLITATGIIASVIARSQTEELFHRPVERSLVGIYLVQDDRLMYVNPRMCEILGYPRETLEMLPFTLCFHPDDTSVAVDRHHRVIDTPETTDDYEIRAITADGRVIFLENLISQFVYQGRPAVIGSIMDITARKESESGLRQSLHEKDILLREVHHRVKNNMQIIVSLLRMQSSMIDNPEVGAVLKESKNRILSMAMVHEKLYRTDNLVSINLLEYISSLANSIITDFSLDDSRITLDIVCDPTLEMTIDAGIPLGLIFNELLTNTFKHGIIADERGKISIKILHTNQGWLDISYRDTGKGLPDGFMLENCDSLGMQLIQNLVFQASGEVIMSSEHGILVKMRIPMKEGFIIGDN